MSNFIPFPSPVIEDFTFRIRPETPALWGKMSAWHMLEHLVIPLRFSRGEFEVPLVTPLEKVEKLKRLMLLSDAPLRRDFAAPFLGPGLQPFVNTDFASAQRNLLAEIQLFESYWNEHQASHFVHPVFGSLNRDEWYLFHSKHFTHHFKQFGFEV